MGSVSDCYFKDNTAIAAFATIQTLSFENVTFIKNTVTNTLYLNAPVDVNNCTFTNNTACDILVNVDGASLNNCSFNNNKGTSSSVINTNTNEKYSLTITNSNFNNSTHLVLNLNNYNLISTNNHYINNHKGVIMDNGAGNGSLLITNNIFENNTGCVNGSAIMFTGKTTIMNSNFTNNNASGYGGALYLVHDDISISGSRFTGNNANISGGAVYVVGDSLKITYSTFTGNNANNPDLSIGDGGAVFINGTYSEISYSVFMDNVASHYGGAVYIADRDGELFYGIDGNTRSGFKNNKALNSTASGETSEGVKYNYTNVYVRGASELLSEVYVVRYPDLDTADGSREHPTSFFNAFKMVANGGSIIFINASEIYDAHDDGVSYNGEVNQLVRWGIKFLGNNTTIKNLRFNATSTAVNTVVKDITFTGCSDTVIFFNAENCTVENCKFIDNSIVESSSTTRGLGIQVLADTFTIKNTVFNNNEISNNDHVGGVLYINASNVNVDNCTFTNNRGIVSNIIIDDSLESITVADSRFSEGGKVDNNGVSISVGTGITGLTIEDCNFTGIDASSNGGAIRLSGSYVMLTLNGNNFTDNAAGNGGALYLNLDKNSTLVFIMDNVFDLNNAVNGGALYINSLPNHNFIFTGNNITNNNADYGGGLFVNVNVDLADNKITGNNATQGGAVFINGKNVVLSNGVFTRNNATLGGAVFINASGVSIIGSEFTGNTANQGGAIYVNGNSTVISNSNFNKNTARDGGAIYLNNRLALNLYNVKLTDNTHTEDNGVIRCGSIFLGDDAIFGQEGLVLNSQQDIWNGTYYASVIYVIPDTENKVSNALGLTSSDPIYLSEVWKHFYPGLNIKIIFVKAGDYKFTEAIAGYANLTMAGAATGITFKRNNDKLLFIFSKHPHPIK